MLNMDLLERIARGEREFRVDAHAPAEVRAAFDQLLEEAQDLRVAGLVGPLRPGGSDPGAGSPWHTLEVMPPGVTDEGRALLHRDGRDPSARGARS